MAKGKLPAFMMKGKDKTAGKKGMKPTFEKGKMPMFAKGGGIESKGKTKGTQIKMAHGGMRGR